MNLSAYDASFFLYIHIIAYSCNILAIQIAHLCIILLLTTTFLHIVYALMIGYTIYFTCYSFAYITCNNYCLLAYNLHAFELFCYNTLRWLHCWILLTIWFIYLLWWLLLYVHFLPYSIQYFNNYCFFCFIQEICTFHYFILK